MSIFRNIKNAGALLVKGEWREFLFNLRLRLHSIDLGNVYLEELGLPAERCHYYANSGGRSLVETLDALQITDRDSILDFGSGKGGALITFSRYPFAKIAGVELSGELVAIATKNLHKLGIDGVTLIAGDAADYTDLDDYNYFYFFCPFPCNVMSAVVKNISTSLTRTPRTAVIIYYNPECHDAVVTDSPFVKVKEFHHHELGFFIYTNEP